MVQVITGQVVITGHPNDLVLTRKMAIMFAREIRGAAREIRKSERAARLQSRENRKLARIAKLEVTLAKLQGEAQ